MGQFASGTWIVGLLLYFTFLFAFVLCVVAAIPDSGLSVSDPGFGSSLSSPNTTIGDIDPAASASTSSAGMSNFAKTFALLSGINSGNTDLGAPSAWAWLFSIIFFYIPLFMLLWAIYMALPIIH